MTYPPTATVGLVEGQKLRQVHRVRDRAALARRPESDPKSVRVLLQQLQRCTGQGVEPLRRINTEAAAAVPGRLDMRHHQPLRGLVHLIEVLVAVRAHEPPTGKQFGGRLARATKTSD
jgi:hypothetical protein